MPRLVPLLVPLILISCSQEPQTSTSEVNDWLAEDAAAQAELEAEVEGAKERLKQAVEQGPR